MSTDSNLLFDIILPILGGLGLISLVWNIYNYYQARWGFPKLNLDCSSQSNGIEKYLVLRTTLENTSRRPIRINNAFLLIVDQPISFGDGITIVEEYISKQSRNMRYETDWPKIIQHYLDDIHKNIIENDEFIIISLPYYFREQNGLGSYAHMTTTHIQKQNRTGIYSIYFVILAARRSLFNSILDIVTRKRLVDYSHSRVDYHQSRLVHDEVTAW
jgi:hypothetical protein